MDRHARRALRGCDATALYASALAIGAGGFALGVTLAARRLKRMAGRAQI